MLYQAVVKGGAEFRKFSLHVFRIYQIKRKCVFHANRFGDPVQFDQSRFINSPDDPVEESTRLAEMRDQFGFG